MGVASAPPCPAFGLPQLFASLSAARLDRGYITVPGSGLIKLQLTAAVLGSPEGYHYNGVSDHAPVIFGFHKNDTVKKGVTALPKAWVSTKAFKDRLQLLYDKFNFAEMEATQALKLYKACIRNAAFHSRDTLKIANGKGLESKRLVLESLSRAIWNNDVRLANRLLRTSDLARQHLDTSQGVVRILNPPAFEVEYADEKRAYLEKSQSNLTQQLRSSTSLCERSKLKSRIQCAKRMASLWWKRAPRLLLRGLRVEGPSGESSVTVTPDGIQAELINYWGPVYSVTEVECDSVQSFLRVYERRNRDRFGFDTLPFPDKGALVNTILHSGDSSPGRDGIPYAAYRALPEASASVLYPVLTRLTYPPGSDGELSEEFLEEFNVQDVVFAPKPLDKDTPETRVRTAGGLRTIFQSNTDNKLIGGVVNRTLVPPMLEVTPDNQRGFCSGRQFTLNIVILDTFMRIFNSLIDPKKILELPPSQIPGLALYDVANAFPTVAHFWLFAVLKCIKLRSDIFNIIYNMYRKSKAYSRGLGTGEFLFWILAGVRTGCPLSATLFVLIMNPFLDLINFVSDGPGLSKSCMCADDIGSALSALSSLSRQYSVFQLMRRTSGMRLKPSKCFLVLSVAELSPELLIRVRNWLAANIPEWKDFQIVSAGKYLGVYLGKEGAEITYSKISDKYLERCNELTEGVAPPLPTIIKYNERVATVFSYVSQVILPPAVGRLADIEQRGVHKMLRLPPKCMSRELMHSFEPFSAVTPTALLPYCSAVMYRYARSQSETLESLHREAIGVLGDHQSLSNHVRDLIPHGEVDETPILNNLLNAVKLDGDFSKFKAPVRACPNNAWILDMSLSPPREPGIQTCVYRVFKGGFTCSNLEAALQAKLLVTLGSDLFAGIVFHPGWTSRLFSVLGECKEFVKLSLFKTFIGGWTTSARMNGGLKRRCPFGCHDGDDHIRHLLLCGPLWHLVGEALGSWPPWAWGSVCV